jgi:hypothetical protein
MSWVFLPGPEADCLPPGCLVGEPSAPSKSIRTVSGYSPRESHWQCPGSDRGCKRMAHLERHSYGAAVKSTPRPQSSRTRATYLWHATIDAGVILPRPDSHAKASAAPEPMA